MGFLEILCLFHRWSLIAGRLPGRTDNEIKNYWNTHIRRKLLNRGIDPATHRPLNETGQAQETSTTISFAASGGGAAVAVKDEVDKATPTTSGSMGKDGIIKPVTERCPDLNLELRISPPYQQQQEAVLADRHDHHQPLKSGGRPTGGMCFSCSLGLQNSKDCSCGIDSINGSSTTSTTGSSNIHGYDFLGLKNNINVLDYRSLEMK